MMSTGPLLLVSKSVRALPPYWHKPLGQLFTPRMLSGLDITQDCRIQWAADNDCFAGFDEDRYLGMLQAITYRPGCLFITCPDVVADARATLRLFDQWHPTLQYVWASVNEADVDPGQPTHQPIALVAQDGQERLPVPWDHFEALFVGGPPSGSSACPLPSSSARPSAAASGCTSAGSTRCGGSPGSRRWAWTPSTAAASPASPARACRWGQPRWPRRRRGPCCEPPPASGLALAASAAGRGRGQSRQQPVSAVVRGRAQLASAAGRRLRPQAVCHLPRRQAGGEGVRGAPSLPA
jgi:hypothetical protein